MSPDQIQKSTASRHSRTGRALGKSLSLPVIHDERNSDEYDSGIHAAPLPISRAHTTATLTSADVALAEVSLGKGANVGTQLSRRLYAKDAARRVGESGNGVVPIQDDQRLPRSPLSLLIPAFPYSQLYYRRVPRAKAVDPKSTELESESQLLSRTRFCSVKRPSISASKSPLLNSPAPVSTPSSSSSLPSSSFPPPDALQPRVEAQTPPISHASSSSLSSSSSTSDFPSLSSSISSTASSSADSPSSPISSRHQSSQHHPHPPSPHSLINRHQSVVSRQRDNSADKTEKSRRPQSSHTPGSAPPPPSSHSPSCHQSLHHHHSRRLTCPCFNTSPSPPAASATTTTTARQSGPSPILIHRSRSITYLSSSASSVSPETLHSIRNYSTVALNNSPVECQSLSRSDAAYIAATSTRSSFGASLFNSKRRNSLFTSSSSPTSPTAATGSHSPDYLTVFFAETQTRAVSIGRRRAFAVSTPSTPGQPPPPAPPSPGPTPRPRVHNASTNSTSDTTGSTTTTNSGAANRTTRRPLSIATKHPSVSAPSSPLKLESTSSSLSAPPSANYNSNSNSNHKILLRSAVTSRLHPQNLHSHHSRHISLLPNQSLSSPFTFSTVSSRQRSRHNTAPSLYRPIMTPQKAEDMSFLTTEHSNHGPLRSIQTTVSGGNWGEPSLPRSSPPQKEAEPNSASSGQDSWTLLSDSGFPIPLNSARSEPGSVSTPISVREAQLNRLPALQLLGRYDDTDPVLDLDVAHQIRLELPRKLRNATKWSLVYSSDQHGISMTTLYHRCKGKGPVILAIKDTTDAIFGAFVTEEFKPNLSYYGTGECFLWNITTIIGSPPLQVPGSPSFGPTPLPSPSPLQLSSSVTTPYNGRSPSPSPLSATSVSRGYNNIGGWGDRRQDLYIAMNEQLTLDTRSPSPLLITPQHGNNSSNNSPSLRPVLPSTPSSAGGATGTPSRRRKKQRVAQFWKWTGKNDYMVLSEPGFIGLGGGDGKFGLWIHSDLEIGHSSRCATFDNEPLAAACHHPIRISGGALDSLAPPAIRNSSSVVASASTTETGPSSQNNSPRDKSDKEEFFCQTVEIWSIML